MNISKFVVAMTLIGSASIVTAGVAVPSPKARATFQKITGITSSAGVLILNGEGSQIGRTDNFATANIRSTDAVIDRCLTLALYAKDKSAMFIFNQSVDDVITCTVSTF